MSDGGKHSFSPALAIGARASADLTPGQGRSSQPWLLHYPPVQLPGLQPLLWHFFQMFSHASLRGHPGPPLRSSFPSLSQFSSPPTPSDPPTQWHLQSVSSIPLPSDQAPSKPPRPPPAQARASQSPLPAHPPPEPARFGPRALTRFGRAAAGCAP